MNGQPPHWCPPPHWQRALSLSLKDCWPKDISDYLSWFLCSSCLIKKNPANNDDDDRYRRDEMIPVGINALTSPTLKHFPLSIPLALNRLGERVPDVLAYDSPKPWGPLQENVTKVTGIMSSTKRVNIKFMACSLDEFLPVQLRALKPLGLIPGISHSRTGQRIQTS